MFSNVLFEVKRFFRGLVFPDEPLADHTSYGIGGKADLYLVPEDETDLENLFRFVHGRKIPWFVIGNGTNLLVSDRGFRGFVVDLKKGWDRIVVEGQGVRVGAGVGLEKLTSFCARKNLKGLEFLAGIPGTVGGAIIMNAGAFGQEISHKLRTVTAMVPDGRIEVLKKDEIGFGYRQSGTLRKNIMLEACFGLEPGEKELINQRMRQLLKERRQRQPLSLPSAGSVFKSPIDRPAGQLIEEAGLKGIRIGDAMVSKKHANFIVNLARARAEDVLALIEEVKGRVKNRFGVELELEIKLIGFD
ncbi:UDP-N-acetylmuramate dehydrogenase [candidate division KSB1 bacterium]|nr:UDP-N-acetylmuramate dehydrogenase [candidate division KSB1 bacterium]